jgi:hypothetical protein
MRSTHYISTTWPSFKVAPSLLKISLLVSVIIGLAVVLIDLKLLFLLVMGLMVLALFFVQFDLSVFVFVALVPLTIQLPVGIHHLTSYSLSRIVVCSWLIRNLPLPGNFVL